MSAKSLLKKNKYICFLSAFALFLCGIATDGHCLAYYKPAYEGRVVDLSTGEPIEGAVVAAFYNSESYGVIQMISGLVGYRETVTDKDGFFHFYPYFSVTGPLTFSHGTTFIIYKPGYQSIRELNLESCLSSGCDSWGEEKYGVVITGKEIGLQKIYLPKERWRAMPSFSSRDYNRSYDELRSTQILTEEYEFLASLNDIHWPYHNLFGEDPWQKSTIVQSASGQEELTEAEIMSLINMFLNDEYTVHWQAYKKLLSSGAQVVPYVHALLDTIEPAKRPKVTKLLWEIGDPSSVDKLCEELQPEQNAGFIEEQQVASVYIPDRDKKNLKERAAPQFNYRTVQKKQTIEDIALALRAFPGQKAAQCLVQALPEESVSGMYVSTTLVGFGSLATQEVVAALPGANALLKRKLLAILAGIADELSLNALLDEVRKARIPATRSTEPFSVDDRNQRLVQQLRTAMEDGSFRKVEYAVDALVRKGPEAVVTLKGLLNREDQRTRILALWGLAKIDDDASRQSLRDTLTNQSPEEATVALYGLGRIGSLEDVEALIAVAQKASHPGLVEAAKKSIGILVYRLGHYSNKNPWPAAEKIAPPVIQNKAAFALRPEFQNLKPGETIKINETMSYTKPPPSARELFNDEWQKRGKQPLDPSDDGLHVLKIDKARSYKNKYFCDDSQLSEALAQAYFSRAKQVSRSSNKNLCYVSGALRNHGKYQRWAISADGTGILFPEEFDDDSLEYRHQETIYLECVDCTDLFN